MIRSTRNHGFQMQFANGITISVQFGVSNYCSNKSMDAQVRLAEMSNETIPALLESPDAEIAIWDSNDHWYDFGNDTVKGYCSADEVAAWIDAAAMAKDIHFQSPANWKFTNLYS